MWQENDNSASWQNVATMCILIITIIMIWHFLVEKPRIEQKHGKLVPTLRINDVDKEKIVPVSGPASKKDDHFIQLNGKRISAQLRDRGLILADLVLHDYKDDIIGEEHLRILSKFDRNLKPYYISAGIALKTNVNISVPDQNSHWNHHIKNGKQNNTIMQDGSSVSFTWNNKDGEVITTEYQMIEDYLIHVKQTLKNYKSEQVAPYLRIKRNGIKDLGDYISHEGVVGFLNNAFHEITYKKIIKQHAIQYKLNQDAWIGISDKYWMSAIIPINHSNIRHTINIRGIKLEDGNDGVQLEVIGYPIETKQMDKMINLESEYYIFVGPKDISVLDYYAKKYNITSLDKAIDFGVMYVISKPILLSLKLIYKFIGNYGWSIVILTILIRIILSPITRMSYISAIKMKHLQPKIENIKTQFKDDKIGMSNAIMALYKTNKVNPISGIIPLLLQAPILFALYKVLYVSLEMRHSSFIFWISDLAAPDQSIFNLLGMSQISQNLPTFMQIGFLPILMCFTIWIQQRLGTLSTTDHPSYKIIKWMPVALVFLFARFASGLLIYWIISNTFGIIQQYWIIKRYKVLSIQ